MRRVISFYLLFSTAFIATIQSYCMAMLTFMLPILGNLHRYALVKFPLELACSHSTEAKTDNKYTCNPHMYTSAVIELSSELDRIEVLRTDGCARFGVVRAMNAKI